MKKNLTVFLILLLLVSSLSGCGSSDILETSAAERSSGEGKLKIVATIFPEYDWVREILGEQAENVELTLLLNNGVDLHSYEPTAEDILKIADSDIFLYVGGESDGWVEGVLAQAPKKERITINLLEALGERVQTEEVVEGMQAEEEDEEEEADEHVWLSLKNAEILCEAIAEALMEADPGNAETYQENLRGYSEELRALDKEYEETVLAAQGKTLLFGDRFPFLYLTRDYGLDYYAAFAGCSAETEASFETIIFLAEKTDELSLPAILTIDGSDGRIAETIRDNTRDKDQALLEMDSMQSVTLEEAEGGETYLSIMEGNLKTLEAALP